MNCELSCELSLELWSAIRAVWLHLYYSTCKFRLQQDVKVRHCHLGDLFPFTVVPLLPFLEVERDIGLELVQEKLLKLWRTGPCPSIWVVNSDIVSSLLCLCSLQNCSSLLEPPRPSSNHPCAGDHGGIESPCPSTSAGLIQSMILKVCVIHLHQCRVCQI